MILPVGYWLGIVQSGSAAVGTAGFWKALIGGIALGSVLIIGRLYFTLRRPLPATQREQLAERAGA